MMQVIIPDSTFHRRLPTFMVHAPPPHITAQRDTLPNFRPEVLQSLATALFRGPVSLSLEGNHSDGKMVRSTGGKWGKGPRGYGINLAAGLEHPEHVLYLSTHEMISLPLLMSEGDASLLRTWQRGLLESAQVLVRLYDDRVSLPLEQVVMMHLSGSEDLRHMQLRRTRRAMTMVLPLYRLGHLTTHGVVVSKLLWLAILSQRVAEERTKEMMRLATQTV